MENENNNIVEESAQIIKDVNQKSIDNIENAANIAHISVEIVNNIKRKSFDNVERAGPIDEYALEANRMVDAVIKESMRNLITEDKQASKDDWLTIDQFSIEHGKQKIEEYIKSWKRGESWLYYIEFLCEDACEYSKRYRYKVQWSIPARRKPIPRATASVYFTIVASTVKPKSFPCDVYYIFETNKLVHRPGSSTFHEKWLKDIVDSKVLLMEAVRF